MGERARAGRSVSCASSLADKPVATTKRRKASCLDTRANPHVLISDLSTQTR